MGNAKAKNNRWKSIRKWTNDIHLWLGLISGIILFIVCLTGTIYTFSSEIKEFLDPDSYHVQYSVDQQPIAAETLASITAETYGGEIVAVTVPYKKRKAYGVVLKKDGDKRGTTHYIDQYTGELKGDGKGAVADFFMTVFRLHRWLALDIHIGRPIVGVATIIFLLMLVSGMVIWVPNKIKYWKQGLKIKTKASFKRLNHDLHNALGFYAFVLMFVMGCTGLTWSFDWYKDGMSSILRTEVFSRKKMEAKSYAEISNPQAVSIEEILSSAETVLLYQGDYRISLPQDEEDVFTVSKNQVGFFAFSGTDNLIFDQYSGEIIQKDIFSEKAFNEKLAASIKPLHMGYIFGTFSKILYFISCLIATSLPVTGTIIWANKLKKKRRKKGGKKTRQKPREATPSEAA